MICPFSSEKKRSIIALDSPDRPGRVCVYMKGAPEIIIKNCGAMMAGRSRIADLEEADILTKINQMAAYPLRVIGLAYMEMDEAEWARYEQSGNAAQNFEEELKGQSRNAFTWVGAFGLKDPLRKNVKECVKYARDQGRLSLRLVSGDHVETAKQVAIKAGILRPEESGRNYAVMTGEQFRSHVGGLTQRKGDELSGVDVEMLPEHLQAFAEIANHIRVLARATPRDRLILVAGLKNLGKTVAVTGSGINDAEAL